MKKIAILVFVVSLITAASASGNPIALQTTQAVELLTVDDNPEKDNDKNDCCKDKKEGECCKEGNKENKDCHDKKCCENHKKAEAKQKECEKKCDTKDDNK